MIWEKLSDEWLDENVSGDGEYALHHEESCDCENGMIVKEKKHQRTRKEKNITKHRKEKKRRNIMLMKIRKSMI